MKRKLPKRSGIAALVLLAGALGVLAWQGSRHLTAASGNTPARLAAVSETVTDTGTLPAEESQPCPQTAAVTRQTETSVTSDSSPQTAVTFPLELNAAGAAELEQLPGIGAVLAQRIVAYRTQIGGFSNREQLLEVEGIGAATLEGLNGWIFGRAGTALAGGDPTAAAGGRIGVAGDFGRDHAADAAAPGSQPGGGRGSDAAAGYAAGAGSRNCGIPGTDHRILFGV